jgi:hypothetical protein
MIKKFLLLIFFILILVIAYSQETSTKISSNPLDRFNNKDYNTFREYIQRNAFFPPEAFNCTGVLLAGFTLSPKGEIKNVFALNSLSSNIDNQILDLIESTAGFWNPLPENEQVNKSSVIIFPIVYCLKNTEYNINANNFKIMLQDKIVLTAMMGSEQMTASGYTTTDKLTKSLNELITKGKYDKANKVIVELLKREPLNTEYYGKLIEIETKLGDSDNACKNFKFVKAYLIQQPDKIDISCI